MVFAGLSCLTSAQDDSVKVGHITRQFTLSDDYTGIVNVSLDTILTGFHEYKVTDKINPFYLSLGNHGLPIEEYDFFSRTKNPDEFLYRHYKPYMHHLGNRMFIDTHVPFSEIVWSYGGKRATSEQTFRVRYSQNVNSYLNVGLDLGIIYSLGQYSYQKTNDRSFTLHTSYIKKKYNLFAALSMNNFFVQENGGLDDSTQLGTIPTRDLPVRLGGLSEALSTMKNKNLLLVQKYNIGKSGDGAESSEISENEKNGGVKGTITHIFTIESVRKFYDDKNPSGEFYDTTYITNDIDNKVATHDSVYSRLIRNTLRFDFKTSETAKFRLGIGVGAMNELNLYSQVIPTHDSLFADTAQWENSSNALVGKVFGNIGDNFGWSANGELYLSGYRSGDMEVSGAISKSFGEGEGKSDLVARGSINNTTPSWWIKQWGSNHFEWNNDYDRELRVNLGGSFNIPKRMLYLDADYALLTNYIYFNNFAVPEQFAGSLSVISIRLNKDFKFWRFRLNNRILLQQSSKTEILDLPALAIKSSFFFNQQINFKSTGGRLDIQLGVEALYYTEYHSSYYMPSTGVYYRQNETTTGNYPFINAFLNVRLKRTRFFFAFDHVNHDMMGTNYYMVTGYPMNVRTFKYGIAWTFYN